MSELDYVCGNRQAWLTMLGKCCRQLGYDDPEVQKVEWIKEREGIREAFEQDEHTDTRNKTLLNLVCEVLEDRASLKQRAERAEYAFDDCRARTINECQDAIERWAWHGARNATELETEKWYKARLSEALEAKKKARTKGKDDAG